jgi:hypothetical protein
MSEVGGVGNGSYRQYCQVLTDSCTVCIDNIAQNGWFRSHSMYTDFTVTCIATEN